MCDQQLTLGELIRSLEKIDDRSNYVYFDFGNFIPTGFASYRGFYKDLALQFDDDRNGTPSVQTVLDYCQDALGQYFQGYKGGSYLATNDSVIWVANYDRSNATILTNVLSDQYSTVYLETRIRPY